MNASSRLAHRLRTATSGRRKLLTQTAGTGAINGSTIAFNFLLSLLLSRILGAAGYGAFAFAVAWASLLAIPAMLGLTPLIVREIATYRVRRDWGRARGLLETANRAVLVASFAASAVAAAVFWLIDWPASDLVRPTLVALPLVPLVAIVAVRQSAMQGLGFVVLARLPEAVVVPALTIVFVLAFDALLAEGLSATAAVGSQVMAAALAALAGVYLLRRTRPAEMRGAEPIRDTRLWLAGALPILVATAIQAINAQAGTILTGSLSGPEEAGIYSVAARVAALLPFLLLATIPPLMPAVAELYERGDAAALQRTLTRAARFVLAGSIPLVVGTFVFAEPILKLFGAEFGEGASALRILCLGQLVVASTGLAGTVLIMIGDAGLATLAVAVGTAANLALTLALAPGLGAAGAATGTAVSIALANTLMVALLWRRRRIDTTLIAHR